MRIPSLLLLLALFPSIAEASALKGVTVCDLTRLSAMYGESPAQVKKMLRMDARKSAMIPTERGSMNEIVYEEVLSARKIGGDCTFAQTSYSYADAQRLATAWGVDPATAQSFVEQKIGAAQEDEVASLLGNPVYDTYDYGQDYKAYDEEAKVPDPDSMALDAFWASNLYTYCDARLVGEAWQTDVYSAKINIGTKLSTGDQAALGALEQTLAGARRNALMHGERCEFWETDYTADDAQQLARIWGISVDNAKSRASDMVLRGQNRAILSALKRNP